MQAATTDTQPTATPKPKARPALAKAPAPSPPAKAKAKVVAKPTGKAKYKVVRTRFFLGPDQLHGAGETIELAVAEAEQYVKDGSLRRVGAK